MGRHSHKIHFLRLKVFVWEKKGKVSPAGSTLHHFFDRTWAAGVFSSKDLIKVFSVMVELVHARHSVWYIHMAMSLFATREFCLNTWSLKRVLHLNYLSGSSGCSCPCPPYSHSSIKGIFTFAGR